jgi:hypothetical protein
LEREHLGGEIAEYDADDQEHHYPDDDTFDAYVEGHTYPNPC